MKRSLQTWWRILTTPRATDENEARREYMTRVILITFAAAVSVFTLPVVIGWARGAWTFKGVGVMLMLDLATYGGWWLAHRGYWRWGGYALPILFFLVAAALTYVNGVKTSAILYYVVVILLAAMLQGVRAQWIMLILSIVTYGVLGWLSGRSDLTSVATFVITVSGLLTGISLLQWLSTSLLQRALDQARAYSERLEQEIVGRQRTEEALRTSEARYRAIVSGSPVSLFALDRDGNLTFVDGKGLDALGFMPNDLIIGRSIFDVYPDQEPVKGILQRVLAGEEAHLVVEGEGVWLEVSLSPLRDETGAITGSIGVATDITEHQQAEQQRLQLVLAQERNKILADFVRDASHEFRTPLSVVHAGLYLLERQTEPEKRAAQIQTLKTQTDFIEDLIENMLKIVQLGSGTGLTFAPLRLDSLLRDAVTGIRPRAEEKGLTLTVNLDESVPVIQGDGQELSQALANLLGNAVDYTPEGGAVTIRSFAGESHAVVEIVDTGVGISPEALPRIFDYFFRVDKSRSSRRAGLGLTIAQKIVEAHQGRIEVESTLGQGSTFRVLLPLSRERHDPTTPAGE